MHKLNGLDHLRAFAITFVFLYHYGGLFPHPGWVNTISRFGWTGVDLFFVLSGYLIASQLFAELVKTKTISLTPFFLKRFFRIIPAYLVVVALYFFLPFIREREAPAPLWKYLTFTQNLGLNLRTQGTFSHAWSLCIEEQFYIVLPLLLIFLASTKRFRKSYRLLLLLFIAGFAIRHYSYQHFVAPFIDDEEAAIRWYKALYYPTYCRLDGLLAGVGLAAASQFLPAGTRRIMKAGNLLFVLSLGLLTGAYLLCLDAESPAASVVGFPFVAIGYGVMVLAAISPSCFLYRLRSVITTTIASLSYSVYLTHKIIIHLTQTGLEKLNIPKESNLMFLLCLAIGLAGAWITNRLIEKPFLKLGKLLVTTKPLRQ